MFVEGEVGLGIQRLRSIDLVTGDQPIYNEDRYVVVVLNGEIYNFRELREELRRRGHRFATEGDTEVIVHLYEEYGADCVRQLHGMFAFALWDERRRRLLLARDRIGKKPLFYSSGRAGLAFASELAALCDESIPRDVDPGALDAFLRTATCPPRLRSSGPSGSCRRPIPSSSRTAGSRSSATGAWTTARSSRSRIRVSCTSRFGSSSGRRRDAG